MLCKHMSSYGPATGRERLLQSLMQPTLLWGLLPLSA